MNTVQRFAEHKKNENKKSMNDSFRFIEEIKDFNIFCSQPNVIIIVKRINKVYEKTTQKIRWPKPKRNVLCIFSIVLRHAK